MSARDGKVNSRVEFVAFVRSLAAHFRSNPDEWESWTIDVYLEALAAWTEDSERHYKHRGEQGPQDINWQVLADMLSAASAYE